MNYEKNGARFLKVTFSRNGNWYITTYMSELVLEFVDLLQGGSLGLAVLHESSHVEYIV